MTVTIYHNPKCSTSRNVLELIREAGIEPQIIDYQKTPLSHDGIRALLGRLDMSPRALLRRNGTPYDELGLDDPALEDDALIDAMVSHPILINRPVVVTDTDARLCRPAATVLEMLPVRPEGRG